MKFVNFYTKLLFRILLIFGLGWSALYFYIRFDLLVFLWLLLLALMLITELIRFIRIEKDEVYYYLLALTESIFSDAGVGKHCEPKIMQAGNKLRVQVRQLAEQKAINHIFLEHVTGQIDSGIICYDEIHRVRFINRSAKKILNRKGLLNVDNLKYRYKELYDALIHPENYKNSVLDFRLNGAYYVLLVKAVKFDIKEKKYTLVSIKDIKEPLDEREVSAWRDLVRYLSHEILNSVIPIANLSDFVKKQLADGIDITNQEEMVECLETVSHRSKGLVSVVNAARQLSHLPKPAMRRFEVTDLLKRVLNLLNSKMEKNHIEVETEIYPRNLSLTGDFDLLEQVLINLINNAIDALLKSFNPKIKITCIQATSKVTRISVEDNGNGIPKDVMDKIFIPFFTTKEKGSGIGLSLSRQIMHLHKGSLNVKSEPGQTKFFMEFRRELLASE
jgi:nitrogen fixation/metabolism regulation signal transduction histidine kinase